MANKRLILDAGHGANTPGRRTVPNGITEWRLNQNVVNFIVEILRGYNVDIRFSNDTTGATDVALGTRVTRTRDFNPHLFVSIHHNAFNGVLGTHTGVEVFVHPNGSAQSRNIANLIAPRLAANTGLRNRGVKTAAWAVLGLPANIPAILVEGGFMDSRIDVPVIESTSGQRAYAKAVADSVIQFLGLTAISTTDNGQTVHRVQRGENLTRIANRYGVTVNMIVQANNLTNPNVINVGQQLIIPTPTASTPSFFPATNAGGTSITDALKAINVDASFANRQRIARANGINNYTGTAAQNNQLLSLLRAGRLVRP